MPDIPAAIAGAAEAAWEDQKRRITYPSDERFTDLPEQTQRLWIAASRASIEHYLNHRQQAEHDRNGQSSRWWAIAWELEQIRLPPKEPREC